MSKICHISHKIKIRKGNFLLLFCCLSSAFFGFTQDYHFSQLRMNPLYLNPAAAGINGRFNAVAIYRSQWKKVASPYMTMGASFDMKFGQPKSNGYLAAGVNFYHDIAGDMKMTTSNIDLSVAYHIGLNRINTFGIGMQVGYGMRGLGSLNGLYASQYNGTTFDTDIISGEQFGRKSFGFLDLGAGFVYNHHGLNRGIFNTSNYNLRIGVAAFHLTRPKYTFLANGNDALAIRYAGFIEAEIAIQNSSFSFLPAIYYQRQGSTQEIMLGTYIKYSITPASIQTNLINGFSIAYGPFYRVGDAFVNKLLIDYNGYAIGFAYDVNLSPLTRASKGQGSFEILFRWHLNDVHRSRARLY